MGDSSGSAEKRTSSKSKKFSARPRSGEGGSEQNSEDKTWYLKCNAYSLVSTGSSRSLALRVHNHFLNKQDKKELERIPPPPKPKNRSTVRKPKTAQQDIQEIKQVDTRNQQPDMKELAANVQNLTDIVMSLTKHNKSKKLPRFQCIGY